MRKNIQGLFVLGVLASSFGCFSSSSETTDGLQGPVEKPSSDKEPAVPPVKEPTVDSSELSDAAVCVPLGDRGPLPWFFQESGFAVTKIRGECTTDEGEEGYPNDGAWVAMGFPCSAGGGRFDFKGKSLVYPRKVSLRLSTDCTMQPASPALIEKTGQELLGLSDKARLLAYYPFALQYWEVLGHIDSDVGFSIELRSLQSTGPTWRAFLKQEPLKIRLYGRENSWVGQGQYYQIEASFSYTGKQNFRMTPEEMKVLSGEELQLVKDRCRSLKPPRACHHAF